MVARLVILDTAATCKHSDDSSSRPRIRTRTDAPAPIVVAIEWKISRRWAPPRRSLIEPGTDQKEVMVTDDEELEEIE